MGKGQDQSKDEGYEVPEKRTETKEESLAPSLLSHIKDGQHKERDLEEAFCRDIDSFNLAFKVSLMPLMLVHVSIMQQVYTLEDVLFIHYPLIFYCQLQGNCTEQSKKIQNIGSPLDDPFRNFGIRYSIR